ncbi:MAG TPA: hypothetical protein VME46_09455 [Acidimicrobiales bacterium]|nr:hypothetical protein [Acidimicrobiales bacterium]
MAATRKVAVLLVVGAMVLGPVTEPPAVLAQGASCHQTTPPSAPSSHHLWYKACG